MTVRAIAHAIVSRYPEAWRQRYEAEVRGLIDDAGVRLRDLGELLHGLFTERSREYLTSDENPRRTARFFGFAAPIIGGVFVAVAWLVSYGIHLVTGTLSDPVQYAGLFVFVALMLVIWVVMWRGKKRSAAKPLLVTPPDVAMVLIPLVFVETVLFALFIFDSGAYSSSFLPPWVLQSYNFLMLAGFSGGLISSLWPGKDLLQAFADLSFAESQLQSSRNWADSCRHWNAKGVPSPLDDALIQIGKWTIECDIASRRLKELGYRARFRGPMGGADAQESAQ